MLRKAHERAVVILIAAAALGYTAWLRQIGRLTADQQVWAVFALGLIAAIVFLFRAARVGEAGDVGTP